MGDFMAASQRAATATRLLPDSDTGPAGESPILPHTPKEMWRVYDPILFDIVAIKPKLIAQQMALVDFQYFAKIERAEFSSWACVGKHKMERSPNIVIFTHRFNNITLWASREILESVNIKRRIDKICHFIEIAQLCFDLNNFFGLKSILAGLQCTPVHRLTKTWQSVPKKSKATFDRLAHLMSPENNFAVYRQALSVAQLPCIPYIGLFLSDLVFLQEAKNANEESMIEKAVTEFSRFQKVPYDFRMATEAVDFLHSAKFISELTPFYEAENYTLSYRLEPKHANDENDPRRAVGRKSVARASGEDEGLPSRRYNGSNDSLSQPSSATPRHILDDPIESGTESSLSKESTVLADHLDSMQFDDEDDQLNNALDGLYIPLVPFSRAGRLVQKVIMIKNVRSRRRAWRRYTVILQLNNLIFYKDKGDHVDDIFNFRQPHHAFRITETSFADLAKDYHKRKHVIRFISTPGTELLLMAPSSDDAIAWIESIDAVIKKIRNKGTENLMDL